MNKADQRNFCLYVTGFSEDTDRRTLKTQFSKFGKVEKLFLENSGKFAKIFYDNKESCDLAIQELNHTALRWQVQYSQYTSKHTENKLDKSSSSISSEVSNMASYRDHYDDDDEEFSENFEYCNVHGQPLVVLQSDNGDIYVNLKDVRKTGFALFRRDTFDSVLVDKRQIGKEFELHLLSEAKNYILKNKAAVIQEEDILKTIERCKNKLLGENSRYENRNNFGPGRSVTASSRNNFTITKEICNSAPVGNVPTSPLIPSQRPPRMLPNNFTPTNSRNNDRHMGKNQERRPRNYQNSNYNQNNTREQNFINGSDTAKQNASNFCESQDNFRKPKPVIETKNEEKTLTIENIGQSETNTSVTKSTGKNEKKASIIENIDKKETKAPVIENIDKIVLDVGSTYEVQVVFVENDKNICWIQKKDDVDVINDMLLQMNEKEEDLENIKPIVGQLVIAEFDGVWSRGRVTSVNPPTVHFIDYGNNSPVDYVKPLLDIFKKTPAFAVRIKIDQSSVLDRDVAEMTIKVKRQYDDGTYLAKIVNGASTHYETEVSPIKSLESDVVAEKAYFRIPEPMSQLKSGDKVMVVEMECDKFLVRTKECAQKCKEITEYIKNLDKTALILKNVKVGQLVLCSKDGLVGLYRAVVSKKENPTVVTVKYIDFPGEDELSLKSIRNVDAFLAQEPSCILLTPEYKCLKNANEKVMEYIFEICQNKTKFTVIISADDFDLQFDNGTLLSEKINDLTYPKRPSEVTPIPQQSKESVTTGLSKASEKITCNDMDWISIESGSQEFICYRFNNLEDVTMIDPSDKGLNYIEQITCLEVTDEVPYTPEELEMCLVLYKGPGEEEACWCRATVLSVENDGCQVSFVDFGNQEKIKIKDIRKFPNYLKDIPMLGINCELVGIPNTPDILESMKKLLCEGDQVEVVVKGCSANSHHKYQIEIPKIYKQLQANGLY